jgi:hypothetical protein
MLLENDRQIELMLDDVMGEKARENFLISRSSSEFYGQLVEDPPYRRI